MRILEYAGVVMFMIGACGMDSENQLIPAAILAAGLAIISLTCRVDKG